MNPRRELALGIALCLLGAALLLFGVGRPWVVLEDQGGLTIATFHREVTGAALEPGLRALGLVALVGVVALVATRRLGRVVLGASLTGVGLWAAVLAGRRLDRVQLLIEAGRQAHVCARNGPACHPPAGAELQTLVAHTAPVWVCLVGALLVVVGGALTAVRGRRWAGLGSSYEPPGAPPSSAPPTDKAVWDALDRGDDPTA